MTTIQDRRREAENTINRFTAQREGCIASLVRYEGRLTLARRKLDRIKRACIRALEKDAAKRSTSQVPAPTAEERPQWVFPDQPRPVVAPADVTDIPVSELPIADDLEIPPFLQRVAASKARDQQAGAEIKTAQAEKKKLKSQVRIETMKAKQRGDLKKMPLTGRAALEAIRNG